MITNSFTLVLQSTLSDMNLALDSSSTGATRQQLQNQTLVYREKNELMQNQLETIFKERQQKEMQNRQLEAAIANEKTKMNEMIFSLSPEEQNRYREHQLMVSFYSSHQPISIIYQLASVRI